MNWLRMYTILIAASIRSRMQYRFNFWFSTLISALVNAVEFLMLAVVLLRFEHIQGWTLIECGYLYGILTLSRAIYRSLASDVHYLERYLLSGDLDKLLLRPVPILLALMTQNFNLRFGELLQGSAILAICMSTMMREGQIGWTAVAPTLMAVGAGAVLLFAIGLLSVTTGFWLTRTSVLQNFTEDAAKTAAQYPMSIYPGWLQGVLTGIIPVAFVNYLPSLYILKGEHSPLILLASWAVALTLTGLGLLFWRVGISRYQSTGS
ncbi:ABC transporter permease [Paenibacillus sp. 1P07SE]|uniref:ABC transporter permease n=1 Tax=Paenibacillus sp. 1P07SE TaxID=3132209 RepID=UPI0039A74B35